MSKFFFDSVMNRRPYTGTGIQGGEKVLQLFTTEERDYFLNKFRNSKNIF